jgi:hypothetical protein
MRQKRQAAETYCCAAEASQSNCQSIEQEYDLIQPQQDRKIATSFPARAPLSSMYGVRILFCFHFERVGRTRLLHYTTYSSPWTSIRTYPFFAPDWCRQHGSSPKLLVE